MTKEQACRQGGWGGPLVFVFSKKKSSQKCQFYNDNNRASILSCDFKSASDSSSVSFLRKSFIPGTGMKGIRETLPGTRGYTRSATKNLSEQPKFFPKLHIADPCKKTLPTTTIKAKRIKRNYLRTMAPQKKTRFREQRIVTRRKH
uniref:Uncharacterized protein n=1 Tax=Romanomermis culicivorax TaxID=13658 RepID=A0A915IJD5_ROMCU